MLQKFIPQSRSMRNVVTLIMGTGLAQAIPIAISPVLTRVYAPEYFGAFAMYLSIVSILSIFVTGRYELAISLPKSDREALHIVVLSLLLTGVLSMILLILIIVFNLQIISFLGSKLNSNWLYWLPISTLLSGIYTNLYYWNNRKEFYKKMAISRIAQTSSSAATQLSMSFVTSGPLGLLVGQLTGQIFSIFPLLINSFSKHQFQIPNFRWKYVVFHSYKYSDFPKIMVVGHCFNAASSQMPVLLLGTLFNLTTAGYYMLIQRLMGAPMALISNAFGDVFRQEASKDFVIKKNCRDIYEKTFKRLFAIAIFPFTFFFFVAPYVFEWVFGSNWKIAGEYAQVLTPMFFLQFVTSPLSAMFMIAQKQKIDLYWQTFLLLLVVLALSIGYVIGSVYISIVLFSAAYSLMYMLNAILAYRLTICS